VPWARAVANAASRLSGQGCVTPVRPGCRVGCGHEPRPAYPTSRCLTRPLAAGLRTMDTTESFMPASDAGLVCRDCGGSFTFSDDERRSFADLGHLHPPSRCSHCRAARKQRQADSGTRAVPPGFRELKQTRTTVVCSSCGESTVVPFAARAGRSVYCSACFQQRRVEGVT
jgi:CxxC-x17-CxxC domain-containing protein